VATSTELLDACVLYPQTLRDLLLNLARTNLFRARWTDLINDEWTRNLLEKHPDKADQVARTLALVNRSVEDCFISDYEEVIPTLQLPDPDDRHVLAAAIVGQANVIITLNLDDFPPEQLDPFGIEAQHPDTFVAHLIALDPEVVCAAGPAHDLFPCFWRVFGMENHVNTLSVFNNIGCSDHKGIEKSRVHGPKRSFFRQREAFYSVHVRF
jgi:predicted nucleic acid-binding protein